MSLFGGQPNAATRTVASGVKIQSSVYGAVVPVVYGRARLAGNLIDYDDFKANQVNNANSGGSGGGSTGSTYDYKASFIFGLCEGTITDVQAIWVTKGSHTWASSGLSLATGAISQSVWGTWGARHASKALAYAGTAYVYVADYDLGSSAQLPNFSYEVTGLYPFACSPSPDADPANVVTDILTNARYGIGFPSARLASLSVFSNYCRAAGLIVSPLYDTQETGAAVLNRLVQNCNSEFVWSGTALGIVPYGDQNLSGSGGTYTAPSSALFNLTDNDFLDAGKDQDPIKCSRKRPSDQINCVRLEYKNRSNAYNNEIVEVRNQAAIEAYGLRSSNPDAAHEFCLQTAAIASATLKLQRQSVRNVYTFTLGWKYCVLDPMDIVSITDSNLGLSQQWVRILDMEENDKGEWKVTAEEMLTGTGHAPAYNNQVGSPYAHNFAVDPGNVNAPTVFEPPSQMLAAMSKTVPQLMIGASGSSAWWGGCNVYVSIDNSHFVQLGTIRATARQGVLTANLASASGLDNSNTLAIDLTQCNGTMVSAIQSDADNFRSLCLVDGELISFWHSSLTSAYNYSLTYLRRGVYGTTPASHSSGTGKFCRLDGAVTSFDLPVTPVNYAGQTLYLKFQSFNIYGYGLQDVSGLTSVTYVPAANKGSISTAQIAANAATAPGSQSIPGSTYSGNAAWVQVATCSITLNDTSAVMIWGNILQGFSSGPKISGRRIKQGGSVIATSDGPGSSSFFNTGPMISTEVSLAAGTYTFTLEWYGEDSTLTVNGGVFNVIGLQR